MATIAAAIQAPSVHNTQPWRFRVWDGAVDVYADRSRQLTVADPDGRAMRLSCGAAIFNLRLAFFRLGLDCEAILMPDVDEPDLMARVVAGKPRPATPLEAALYDAIAKRHTNRSPFLDTDVPLDVRASLVEAAKVEGAWFDLVVGPAAVEVVAELIRAADRILTTDDAYRAELASWTRRDTRSADGVPREAGGPAPEPHDLLALRDFGGAPRGPGHDYESDPLIGVLGSSWDTPANDLVAGQALQRVLLTATSAGLVASLMSQPIDVPRIRRGSADRAATVRPAADAASRWLRRASAPYTPAARPRGPVARSQQIRARYDQPRAGLMATGRATGQREASTRSVVEGRDVKGNGAS